MNKTPLISIVMPAYNAEKYIEQAIDSVINQTYDNWELIVLDDGSSDNTKAIIVRKAEKDYRIHFYENAVNMGVSATRNRGVKVANGEWIAFLDSDDAWENEKLEKQVQFLNEHENARIIFTASSFINEENKKANYILHVPTQVGFKELLKQNVISCSSALVQKKYLEKYAMPGDKLHEDYTVWLKILEDGSQAYGIDEPLLIYRISSNSKSGNKINAAKMQMRVYQYLGLNIFQSVYYMICYTIRNLKKYRQIHKTI